MTGTSRDHSIPSSEPLSRSAEKTPRRWCVRAEEQELFVYVYLGDVKRVGLFLPTCEPLTVGVVVDVILTSHCSDVLCLRGEVQWINPWHADGDNLNPGMGILLPELESELRERLVTVVHTLVFLR